MSSLCRHPCSSVAPPLEDDDLLSEILLRLPPQPSSLPHASLVSKRWRRLVSDRGFIRRFCLRHRRNPPLLGCVIVNSHVLSYVHTLEPPNRVPLARFSLHRDNCGPFVPLGCRHGLVLMLDEDQKDVVLVWDPFTGDHHRIALPLSLHGRKTVATSGAVLRPAGDLQHYQVVMVVTSNDETLHRRVLACVYSSETGGWGKLISIPLTTSDVYVSMKPAVMDKNSLYWQLVGDFFGILEFDLERQSLAVIPMPVNLYGMSTWTFTITRQAEGGGLGLLIVSDFCAKLWKRVTYCDGIAAWVLMRTIELDKLLSLKQERDRGAISILGFAEDNNVVFLWTSIGVFMVHLEPLHFKELSDSMIYWFHPFENVYAKGI